MFMTISTADLEATLPDLRRFAVYLTNRRDEADDLLQASLERALVKQHLYKPGTNLRSWLMTMMRNVFISQKRQASTRRRYMDLLACHSPTQMAPPQGHSVHLRETLASMDKLPAREREALHLLAVEELTHEEAAQRTGVAVGTMKSRLSRARSGLRASHGTEGAA
jgi:RNA polymerase sigma-70 factor (ECF subfamily)